jgi:hypothetical protein
MAVLSSEMDLAESMFIEKPFNEERFSDKVTPIL